MRVVVPFAAETPKTRLASVLDPAERSTFARAMLADVVTAIASVGFEPTVLSTAPLEGQDVDPAATGAGGDDESAASIAPIEDLPASVAVDDRPLTEAVDARLPRKSAETVAVVMADLALATPASLEGLFAPDADVVIAPGRGGGTNALVVRDPAFRVDYHGASFLDHRRIAREAGASVEVVDSYRLATDVDEPADLVEVLVHGEGRSARCLREFGFELATDGGRVQAIREADSVGE